MKYAEPRPYADPEKAARRLIEIASTVEPVQDGRIHVELINGPFLFKDQGSPAGYGAGMKLAIERGWLIMHEIGTFVRFTPAGTELFAWTKRKRPPTEAASKVSISSKFSCKFAGRAARCKCWCKSCRTERRRAPRVPS